MLVQPNGDENSVLVIDIVLFFKVSTQFNGVNQVIFFQVRVFFDVM